MLMHGAHGLLSCLSLWRRKEFYILTLTIAIPNDNVNKIDSWPLFILELKKHQGAVSLSTDILIKSLADNFRTITQYN